MHLFNSPGNGVSPAMHVLHTPPPVEMGMRFSTYVSPEPGFFTANVASNWEGPWMPPSRAVVTVSTL
jgi:hypothetical protein